MREINGRFQLGVPAATAHRFVRLLDTRLRALGLPRDELARRTGLGSTTCQNWWDASGAILLQNMEAALEAVGYRLAAVSIPERAVERKFKAGDCYRMRQGGFARIERASEDRLHGRMLKGDLPLEWTLAGRRIPVAGDDPSDLVPP